MSRSATAVRADLLSGATVGVLAGAVLAAVGVWSSPYLALAALVGALGALLVVLRPETGLYVVALVVPIERIGRFTGDAATVPISLMRTSGLAVFAVYALHFLAKGRRPYVGREGIVLAGFVAYAISSQLWSSDPHNTTRAMSLWVGNLMFFILIVNGVRSSQMARRLLAATLLSATLIGTWTLYQWYFQGGRLTAESGHGLGQFDTEQRFVGVFSDKTEEKALGERDRLAGPTSHPTVYANNLLCLLPIAGYFLLRQRRPWAQLLLAVGLGVLGINLVLTGTRAAMLTAGILGAIAIALRIVRIRPGFLALMALLAVLGFWFVPTSITERIFNPENYTVAKADALRTRLTYWSSALGIVADHWVFGVGFANMAELPRVNQSAPLEGSSVHNSILQITMELGIVGLSLWLTFLGLALHDAIRATRVFARARRRSDALLCSLLGLTVLAPVFLGATADCHHFPNKIWWLAVALLAILRPIAEGRMVELTPVPIVPRIGLRPLPLGAAG